MRIWNMGPVLILALYAIAALYSIGYPGLHYDELYYINGSLGNLDGTLVTESIFGVPAFHVFYQGFLKAWIMAPVFWLFDTNYYSTRIPNIVFTLVFMAIFYRTLMSTWGKRAALFSLLILTVHPDFFWFTRLDFSPVVLELILQWTALLLFLQGTRFLPLPILIGLFNKLTFLWWSLGFFLNGHLFYSSKRKLLLFTTPFLLAFIFFRGLNSGGQSDFFSTPIDPQKLNIFLTNGGNILSGVGFFQKFIRSESLSWILIASWVGILAASFFMIRKEKKGGAPQAFAGLILGTIIFQLLFLTFLKDAPKPWHLILMLPQFAAIGGFTLAKLERPGWIGILLLVFLYFPKQVEMLTYRNPPMDIRWSPSIIDLADFCRINFPCISVDWGIHNQLLGILRDPQKVQEFKGDFTKNSYYILFPSGAVPPTERINFFSLAEKKGIILQHQKSTELDLLQSTYKIYRPL